MHWTDQRYTVNWQSNQVFNNICTPLYGIMYNNWPWVSILVYILLTKKVLHGTYITTKSSLVDVHVHKSYCDWITGLLDSLKPGPEDIWLFHQ